MAAKRCNDTRTNGKACNAWALPGRKKCWAHDPSTKKKRQQARKLGGRARKYKQVDPPGTVSTIDHVLQGINAVIARAWARDSTDKNDRVLLAAYQAAESIVRPNDTEERLTKIEEQLGIVEGSKE